MPAHLNPYLMLGDTARPALEFYRGVFGGEIEMRTYADVPGTPPENADRVMHSSLTTSDGRVIMAADSPEGARPPSGDNVAISVSSADRDVNQAWWDGLSAGGTVEVPFVEAPWGHRFGMCIDKFGIRWMVSDDE
ncbi:VOC family protein [Gordonia neofelifaecis]|uniref:Glyoxalase/bleomycin resistance protein/dioxygenase n=1 Tax=Gordonia neofelifaecis NRRL B-59395 TaxID=644548 RepID=F1YP23_9ACTN|nr:VOC family protein [Gordonia neofelifaecis]EGD53528.1 Glyoxalase/bleomycin resistance protein/dioxygenase [Gordonia neofelifaecis NRRL B-59395]